MLLKMGKGRALLDEGDTVPNTALFCTVVSYQTLYCCKLPNTTCRRGSPFHPGSYLDDTSVPFWSRPSALWLHRPLCVKMKNKFNTKKQCKTNVTYQSTYIRLGIVKRAAYSLRCSQVSNLFVHQNVELIVLWSVPGARGWDIYWARNLSTKNSCFIIPVVSTEQPKQGMHCQILQVYGMCAKDGSNF